MYFLCVPWTTAMLSLSMHVDLNMSTNECQLTRLEHVRNIFVGTWIMQSSYSLMHYFSVLVYAFIHAMDEKKKFCNSTASSFGIYFLIQPRLICIHVLYVHFYISRIKIDGLCFLSQFDQTKIALKILLKKINFRIL